MRTQLHQIVAAMAGTRGDAPALTYKDTTVSYSELWHDVRAFAAGLRELGVERGDRAATYAELMQSLLRVNREALAA